MRINLGKSEIVSVGEVENIEELASVLCCRVSRLPMTYLGMELESGFMEFSSGEDGKKISGLEETLFIQRWQDNSHKEYVS